jgi:succinate dehydrogenase / fumarate reductase, cytochrome b subunit
MSTTMAPPPPAREVEAKSTPHRRTLLTGRSPFLLRRLHSLTGILFGLYVLLHLSVNATLVEGARYAGEPTVYQQQVTKIHELPFLQFISYALLILPIVYHTIWGVYVTVNGRPNVADYGYGRNWLYLWQRITALILILFIAFHYLAFKGTFDGVLGSEMRFVPSRATESTVLHFQRHWWIGWIVYPIGVLAATFHTANGFWAAGVSWGLTVSRGAMRRWAIVCALLFVALTALGFTAIVAVMTHETPPPIDSTIPRVEYEVPADLV